MRLGFAIAANLDPDVLLLDEIFAVGDEDFQSSAWATLKSFQARAARRSCSSRTRPRRSRRSADRACLLDRGQLRLRRRRSTPASPNTAGSPPRRRTRRSATTRRTPPPAADDDRLAWHRLATGGRWAEEGAWVFDFLRAQGLRPDHYVLDVGCGSLSAASRLLPYMEQSHYWGFEKNIELYIAGVQIELPRAGVRAGARPLHRQRRLRPLRSAPHPFDLAIASSLLSAPAA